MRGRVRMAIPEELVELFRREDDFLLFTHIQPDGDTLGSALGLGLALRDFGKKVTVVRTDPVPEIYLFLPGVGEMQDWRQVQGDFRVGVLLDCADPERIGEARELLPKLPVVVNIDHHGTNSRFGHYNYVEPQAAAVGEQVYELLHVLSAPLSPAAATCLYTAILTDTGSFRYESTSAKTLRVAAALVEAGAKPAEVAEKAFETRSLSSLRLLGRALNGLELSADGRIAWMSLSREDMAWAGAAEAETEGLINYARSVQGVEVALLFRATPENKIRVSLRSRHWVDVSQVAASFGGGGHPRAAGCTLSLPLKEAQQQVLAKIEEALGEAGGR